MVGNRRNVHAADGNIPLFRLIKPQQQPEHRAFARACSANQRDLLPFLHGHGEVGQHRLFAVAERHMGQHNVAARGILSLLRNGAFRLIKERVDALDTRHSGLNRLNLHAEAFNRRKNAGNVIDDGDRCTDRHAEQCQHIRIARRGEQHHDAHDGGVKQKHDGRVNRVVEIRLFHRGIAFADALVIALLHVAFQPQGVNGADVVQRFRYLPGHGGDGATVLQLRGEHPLLHKTGENGEQRQNHQQHQCKPRVLHGNHCQNRDDAAGIRHHADDAGGEQRLDSIHITRKARGNLAGILPDERAGGQRDELLRHFGAQGVRHLLPEQHQQRFLRRGERPLQHKAAEVEQHGGEQQRHTTRQPVNYVLEQQRRNQRRGNRCRNTQQRADRQYPMRPHRCLERGNHARFFLITHVHHPRFGSRKASGMSERMPSIRHACRPSSCRPP